MSRLATRGSDPIDQATIRGYVLIRLRREEEEEVCTGGRAELYTCWGAEPLAKPLTKPCLGDEHQRRHSQLLYSKNGYPLSTLPCGYGQVTNIL